MAKLKLTELDQISDIRDSDLLYVVQSGVSKSANVKDIVGSLVYQNISANAFIQSVNGIGPGNITITTSNIEEDTNLYYTNARVQSYLETQNIRSPDLSGNTTTDLAEGDNLYYTNTRIQLYLDEQGYSNTAAQTDLTANTTTDLAEGDNLYYANTRADENFIEGMRTDRYGYFKIPSSQDSAQNILANTYLANTEIYPFGLMVFNTEVEKLQVFIPAANTTGRWANVVLEGNYGTLPSGGGSEGGDGG